MAKLDALKEKLAGLKLKLTEKLEKNPFLKKFAVKPDGQAGTAPSYPPSPTSLEQIYRNGGMLTRLQVAFFVVFLLGMIVSAAFVGKRMFQRLKENPGNEKMVAEVSHGIGDIQRRMEENAKVLSLGKFTVNAFVDERRRTAMSIDIWLRVSGVETANFVQSHEAILHDKATDAMNELYMERTSLLSEQGKEKAKKKLITFLNSAIPKGQVEEVFFYNMVAQ